MKKRKEKPPEKVWAEFKERQHLSDEQVEKFKKYAVKLEKKRKKKYWW